ncbi:hypothetical protein HMPREF3293_00462 [Christensenella minuta]|uniref:Uncharacterized protein n=1 Tax=Christensenella minuta TaxID=626937 RepID=A0A136Q7H7_9FIRM|nr:hypothetical protein HMPREF3293_00462 [Christensenella minuta]
MNLIRLILAEGALFSHRLKSSFRLAAERIFFCGARRISFDGTGDRVFCSQI